MIEAHSDQLFDDGFSWVAGNPEGDVTVVEAEAPKRIVQRGRGGLWFCPQAALG